MVRILSKSGRRGPFDINSPTVIPDRARHRHAKARWWSGNGIDRSNGAPSQSVEVSATSSPTAPQRRVEAGSGPGRRQLPKAPYEPSTGWYDQPHDVATGSPWQPPNAPSRRAW